MRTTLVIDDEVLRQARKRAAERNLTVSDIVNEALREAFARPRPTAPPFSMITYGRSGQRVRHRPEDFAAGSDQEDMERRR